MSKSLIITEKPSVAREFAQVLSVSGRNDGYIENDNYVITWCVGHLVEMVYPEEYDERYKKWRLEDLPFLPKNYKYHVIPAVKKQYDVVSAMLHRTDIDTVYWAGDAGKEGQTIEENIRNFGGVRKGMRELRVWIDSQTQEEILRGLREAKPMSKYANLGKSGIMRSIEDYAMGINFSRVLSVKYGSLLNQAAGTASYTAIAVGRVMTCVLGMVVIREREIRNFQETPFYRVLGTFAPISETGTDTVQAEWRAAEDSEYWNSPFLYKENGFKEEAPAKQLLSKLDGKEARVFSIEKGISRKKAPLLFNLAELQAECSKRFKISPDETLQAAQELYEKKLTTYPRTDARVLSTAAAKEIGKNISRLKEYEPTKRYAEKILNERLFHKIAQSAYVDDSKVTDHYAIIPTGQLADLDALTSLQKAIFDLIVRRFFSIFYPPAEYQTVKLVAEIAHSEVTGEKYEKFFASTKVLKTPGYLEIAGYKKAKSETDTERREERENEADAEENRGLLVLCEQLQKGDALSVIAFEVKEGKTSPPKRYTSGSMVLAMENAGQLIEDEELRAQIKGSGIGTSATRAEIIKKLVRIGYLNLNKKSQILTPETMGEMVFEAVNMTAPALLNPKMTASWEKGLDGITKGTVIMEEYRGKLEDFIRKETLAMVERDQKQQLIERIQPLTGKGARGIAAKKKLGIACPLCGGELETTPFGYGCSNYKKDGTGCRFSVGAIAGRDLSEEEFTALIKDGYTKVLSGFVSKTHKKFSAALVLEKDENDKIRIGFDFEKVGPEVIAEVNCPACGGAIVKTPFGYACEHRSQNPFDGCYFAVGKMAEKDLSTAQLKELLTSGRTSTIRGFKSKNGKKFDACIALEKEETGRYVTRFDFEHVETKKVKDAFCPKCGGEILVVPFGYVCANRNLNTADGCDFSIGKIAEKDLTMTQVKELLLNGRTSTIRGFKAKSGKKFDACITLNRDETGVIRGLKFDFEHAEAKKLKDVYCPRCKGEIIQTPFGFGCVNYVKEDPESCRFSIGKIAGVKLKEAQVRELLLHKKTEIIKGFVAKTGMMFDAPLKLTEDGRVVFDFPEKPKPQATAVNCPNCQKLLMKSQWYYECECGFRVSHTVAKTELSEEWMRELFETGRTKNKVNGFISKAGNVFSAYLKWENDRISFDFDEAQLPAEAEQKTEKNAVSNADERTDYYEKIANEMAAYQEMEREEQLLGDTFF